jgi:deoxycytidylate deaminase
VKTIEQVKAESTCLKRITICEIYDLFGNLLARESNRCNPPGGVCGRMGVVQNKKNYDKESTCNWTHAEINAINALPEGSKPYSAIVLGHSFLCDNCEQALKKVGVQHFLTLDLP